MGATSERWTATHELENLKAICLDVTTRLSVISTHAKRRSGNWGQVLLESEMARGEMRGVERILTEKWDRLYHLAMYNGLPHEDET